jgi:hypothetical protein
MTARKAGIPPLLFKTLITVGIRYKAQNQLMRDQSLHQTFSVGKVILAPLRRSVRLRLCQVQCS